MANFASGTKVSEAKSHFDLQKILKKFGCKESGYMENEGSTSLLFAKDGVTYRFTFKLPTADSEITVDRNYRPGTHGSKVDYERMRKMRALVAVVKAQLIAIEEGIITFEEMFVGHIVTDNGQTIAERWAPQAQQLALEGRYPSALPGVSS